MEKNQTKGIARHTGSCHCGEVRFEVEIDPSAGSRCNCTICTKLGVVGAIVKPGAFTLVSKNEAELGHYVWGGKVSHRYFCKRCGVYCYARGHLEQLGGDYVSINLNCLDDIELAHVAVRHWDGRHNNWMAGMRDTPWPIFATPS
jgi:hypothetical protein